MTLPSAADLLGVVVVIPVLNEESSLSFVLNDLPTVGHVIVVDNGSHDQSASVAISNGATVVSEPVRGYGAACLRGLQEVDRLVDTEGFHPQVVVFLDGDYSDHPDELPNVVAPIFRNVADFVIGSRLAGELEPGAMPPQSRFGNVLACFLMRVFFGARYTDLGPFRAIRLTTLRGLRMVDRNFGWTVEMQIKAAQQNIRSVEVPVSYRKRIGVSKISGTIMGTIKAGYKILFLIAKYGIFQSRRGGD